MSIDPHILQFLASTFPVSDNETHGPFCWLTHLPCALHRMVNEVETLDRHLAQKNHVISRLCEAFKMDEIEAIVTRPVHDIWERPMAYGHGYNE